MNRSYFEPDVAKEGTRAEQIQASQAISLKRIADALERRNHFEAYRANIISSETLVGMLGLKR